MVSDNDILLLSQLILQNLQDEFASKHLSKNLVNTIAIEKTEDGIAIVIPAKTYNMLKYQKEGVIVYTSHGSYASKLNDEGSEFFIYPNDSRKGSKKIKPHNHIGYADNAINKAIETWKQMISGKYNVGEIRGL